MPLDVRKSCAFPTDAPQDSGGSAADLRHSLEEVEGDATKQSFAAHRQAEPEKKSGKPQDLTYKPRRLEAVSKLLAKLRSSDIIVAPRGAKRNVGCCHQFDLKPA